jgi:hypothetical protein
MAPAGQEAKPVIENLVFRLQTTREGWRIAAVKRLE